MGVDAIEVIEQLEKHYIISSNLFETNEILKISLMKYMIVNDVYFQYNIKDLTNELDILRFTFN